MWAAVGGPDTVEGGTIGGVIDLSIILVVSVHVIEVSLTNRPRATLSSDSLDKVRSGSGEHVAGHSDWAPA